MSPPTVISPLVERTLWTAAAVLLTYWLWQYVAYRVRLTRKLAGVPGLSYPLPLIGHLVHMLGPMDGILERGNAVFYRYGPRPIKFWIGETPSVQLMRPEDIEPVLNSQREVDKPDLVYKPVRGFFGDGLITLNGEAWFKHRRALTPAFHFTVLERYAGIFTRRAADLAGRTMRPMAGHGRTFNVNKCLSAFVTETIMETAFGMRAPAQRSEHESRDLAAFVSASEDAFNVIINRVFQPWLLIDAIFQLSPWGAVQRHAEAVITGYAKRVIALKKEQLQQRALGNEDADADAQDDDDGVRKKYTFLDMALAGKTDVISDAEILEEVRTLIAVQQTSASTLSFVMVMLALYPEVQEEARREVLDLDAAGAADEVQPLETLKRLKYVERVIKETLRLFPITAIFARKLKEDVKLPDCTLPGGVMLTIFPYQTHRDPRHWPDPERFDPDRFLPDNCVGRHPYAYVPFSAGPRNCIGQRYAMLQMKAVVAAVLRRYAVLPGEGCETRDKLRICIDTFLYIKGGFNVRLRPLADAPVDP